MIHIFCISISTNIKIFEQHRCFMTNLLAFISQHEDCFVTQRLHTQDVDADDYFQKCQEAFSK